MFTSIPSLDSILQCLLPAFTQPSFRTHVAVLLGWVMCLRKWTEYGVFETIRAGTRVSRKQRHPFDRFYNFFSRSAWTVRELACQIAVAVVVRLSPQGPLHLVVDDTLLHKHGKHVWGLGWFRDAAASTPKRTVIASGNHWVVMGLAIGIPGTNKIYCLPIHAKLHRSGKGRPGEAALAKEMLADVLAWFPDREFIFLGDGAYSTKILLGELDPRITYIGVMRGDAAIFDPRPPKRRHGKGGPKPRKGPRLPSPRKAIQKANRRCGGPWVWRTIKATAYGTKHTFQVLSYEAVWPRVLGLRPIQVVLVRDPLRRLKDAYWFTTDLSADPTWIIETFSRRWSIEVAFKASKQVQHIESPQHWCRRSIERLAPWVWLMQSVIGLWYLSEGRKLPQARAARQRLGPWDTEWSFRHMLRVLHSVILEQTITITSATKADLHELLRQLENYLSLAV
jgi:hypothetical protein